MKKFLNIFVLFIVLITFGVPVFADVDESKFIEQGNFYLEKYLDNESPEFKDIYLNKAMYYFYVASKNSNPSVYSFIGLGRVYTLQNRLEDARNTFMEAYSLDYYNADTNFYFAKCNYEAGNYKIALKMFENANKLGYKNHDENLLNIAKCYEKLGDLQEALEVYKQLSTPDAIAKSQEIEQILNDTENKKGEKND